MTTQNAKMMLKNAVDIPAIMAPMFIISNPKMVINACASGVIGTFPALNARTSDRLEEWMQEIHTEIKQLQYNRPGEKIAPWGINLIVHRSNKRYLNDLDLIKTYQPPIVITSLGDPGPVAEIVHGYDGVVLSDVTDINFAKKALEKGSDGLVLVAAGAGGHGGTYNPISFVHEVRAFFDGPLVLSGGMTQGKDILAAEILGADFAYLGTRFIPSVESSAQEAYKNMVVDSSIEDIIYTDAFSGINANYLVPSITASGLNPDDLKTKEEIDFSTLQNSSAKAWKDIWGAGQGVGAINNIQTVEEIVDELKMGYRQAVEQVTNLSHQQR